MLNKKKINIFALFILFFIGFSQAGFALTDTLGNSLNTYISKFPAKTNVYIYLESTNNKTVFKKNENKILSAASIIKIPVMIEVMEQVKEKKFKLQDKITLSEKDKVSGSGVLKSNKSGLKLTIYRLVYLMITESDNTATNMLINKVGMQAINIRMQKLGLTKTFLQLLIMDFEAASQGKDNYTSAYETAILLKKIYNNQIATPDLCQIMINILKKTKNNKAILKFLPSVPVAHKTGSLYNIYGDTGIIYTERPFILSIFVQGQTIEKSEKIIGDIAKISFEYLK